MQLLSGIHRPIFRTAEHACEEVFADLHWLELSLKAAVELECTKLLYTLGDVWGTR